MSELDHEERLERQGAAAEAAAWNNHDKRVEMEWRERIRHQEELNQRDREEQRQRTIARAREIAERARLAHEEAARLRANPHRPPRRERRHR